MFPCIRSCLSFLRSILKLCEDSDTVSEKNDIVRSLWILAKLQTSTALMIYKPRMSSNRG